MTIKNEFINRKDEMEYLESEYAKKDFRFISIIGRRRLGKTRFIEEFLKNKTDYSYFMVPELNDAEVRLEISKKLHEDFKISFIGTPSWDDIFDEIFAESANKRMVMAIDEFQRIHSVNKSVFSLMQKYIDRYARKSRMFLIVSGSSIGMMHKIFDYASPLYGRRTGQIYFQPMGFFSLRDWFPSFSIENLVEIYAIYGGTPKYLEEIESGNVVENIAKILSKRSILYNEPEILIKTELPGSSTYFNILKGISQGASKSSEIANIAGIKTTSIDYFLNVLINDMDVVKREIPVTEMKSKKPIYAIKDNFFKFWFRYILSSMSDIEMGNVSHVMEKIKSELNMQMGFAYEEISIQFLTELNRTGGLGFTFERIGRQWGKFMGTDGKNTYEIDAVALNENTKDILFCECKWQNNVNAGKILAELKEKAGFVQWNNDQRHERYAIFAKSFKEKIKEPGLMLFDLNELEKIFR